MDNKEIKLFIDNMIYDFETVRGLQEFRRNKETLLVVDLICNRIEQFQQRSNEGPYDLKGIFDRDFWERPSFSDLRAKVRKLAGEWNQVADADLKQLDYEKFISLLELWALKNIDLLKKKSRSDLRKNIEKIAVWSLAAVVCAGLVFFVISKVIEIVFQKKWGLKGDFYAGEHFEKPIYSGLSKTINFSNVEEMNCGLTEYFSARWQGELLAPRNGEYTLALQADDGATLFLDGQRILSAVYNEASGFSSQKIFLNKGSHKIVLEYYQNTSQAYLKLFWTMGNGKPEVIPARYLRASVK